ncbi:MAG: hypothetical protein VKL39_06170 [Leptolyngbyaceae bacterium]|nr:hypothetical protein [Leptolyngbyaceae bacterium]
MVYQLEPQPTSHHLPHMPCPQCKKTTIVQHGSLYACVSCNYRKDICSDEGQSSNPLIWILVGGLILLVL